MIWCNANFQCIFHLNHLVNSNFIWTCNKFCCIIHIEYSSYREKLECEYDTNTHQWRIYIVKFWMRPPPPGSKFCQFHAVFGTIWQNRMLAPPGGLAPHFGEIIMKTFTEGGILGRYGFRFKGRKVHKFTSFWSFSTQIEISRCPRTKGILRSL